MLQYGWHVLGWLAWYGMVQHGQGRASMRWYLHRSHFPYLAAAFLAWQPYVAPSLYGSRHLPYTAAATFLIRQPPPSSYGRRHLPYTAAATFLIRQPPPSSYGSRHLPYTAAATFLIRPPPPSSYGSRHLPYMAATLLEAPSWWRPSPRDLEAADTFVSKHRTLAVQV
jgi:hypothetical protein